MTQSRLSKIVVTLTIGAAMMIPATAYSGTANFLAVLNGGQEAPPNVSTGQGVAHLTFDTKTSELCWAITYSGLVGNVTGAHIHGPASVGTNAGIVVFLTATNPIVGCETVSKDTAKALKKGNAYINIHSDISSSGEIRGQIYPQKGGK